MCISILKWHDISYLLIFLKMKADFQQQSIRRNVQIRHSFFDTLMEVMLSS